MSFKLTVHWSLPTVTRVLIAAATLLLITCAAKLTFIVFRPTGLICLSVTLGSRRYTLHLSTSYNFNMSSHSAVPVSRSPLTVISHSTFATLYLRKRLRVHLRRCGGSNI